MSCWIRVELPSGHEGAGLAEGGEPWVVLHASAFMLSDRELKEAVVTCSNTAWYALACNKADWITCNFRNRRPCDIPDEIFEHRDFLSNYSYHENPLIDEALGIIDRVEEYRRNKAAKPQKRRDIQQDYNNLFMAIGRRDGFHCSCCRITTGLQIDHRQALANGGTNELDNLQLLCGPCNSRKGVS